MERKISRNGYHVVFDETLKLKEEVYEACLKWYIKHDAFIGEVIEQSDNCITGASGMLADLADNVFKFQYKEE